MTSVPLVLRIGLSFTLGLPRTVGRHSTLGVGRESQGEPDEHCVLVDIVDLTDSSITLM